MNFNINFVNGMLSIMASLMRDEFVSADDLYEFVKKWQSKGHFKDVVLVNNKNTLSETILTESILDTEVRKDLQKCFGQFDQAQVCECCGRIIREGYSWGYGATYCTKKCVIKGENITDEEFKSLMENDSEDDSHYYRTKW